jgi:UDP-N-acetylmuramyl tripeptide synthase
MPRGAGAARPRRRHRAGIGQAGPDDIVLVAGKGHEPYQEIAGVRHPFDDTAVAARFVASWRQESRMNAASLSLIAHWATGGRTGRRRSHGRCHRHRHPRALVPRSLFVALQAASASTATTTSPPRRSTAAAWPLLVARELDVDAPQVVVADTERALARIRRRRCSASAAPRWWRSPAATARPR